MNARDEAPEPQPEERRPETPQETIPERIPVILSAANVMYPQQLVPVLATEQRDIQAIDLAAGLEAKVLGVFSQQLTSDGSHEGAPCEIGTAASIVRMVKAPDGSVHAILQGIARIELEGTEVEGLLLMGRVKRLDDTVERNLDLEAKMRDVMAAFQRVTSLTETMPNELSGSVTSMTEPSALADFVAANLQLKTEDRYAVLAELDVNKRLAFVLDLLNHEAEVLEVQSEIQAGVRGELDRRQREFILREQLKAIQKELGEGEITPELSELKERLDAANLPEAAKKESDRELQRLGSIPSISPEYQVARTYLEWLADLPWDKTTEDHLDIKRAEMILNEDHYGLEKVKRRILDFLAV
ncbi:MAG TPA: LON peptidase substrate-binding domain-containing protein, partial [Dehalococcoidia bacterium]|nr:LON peptidase substrate-binding domain-containing protein [Dehalococcoidia bacterium]